MTMKMLRLVAAALLTATAVTASDANVFVNGKGVYDSYQQAWRMLGFFVDCAGQDEDDHHDRKLQGGEQEGCQRYLLWAAYVDLDYQGGGLGEYSMWDPTINAYSNYTCEVTGSERCVPMDCHEPKSTNWQLLGIYKEAAYAEEWMEQLFKHSGYCIWDEDTYEFMQDYRDSWPEGCQETDYMAHDGSTLYLDIKPVAGGNIGYALYTDESCKTEYTVGDVQIQDVVDAQEDLLPVEYLNQWNSAMNVYKQCLPCPAADLRQSSRRRRRAQEGGGDDFTCNDDAGYENVNQCMKFRTHTYMEVATWSDLEQASHQGGLMEIQVGTKMFGSARLVASSRPSSLLWLVGGSATLIIGVTALLYVAGMAWLRRVRSQTGQNLSDPLVSK